MIVEAIMIRHPDIPMPTCAIVYVHYHFFMRS
jgi:hypothetical protein